MWGSSPTRLFSLRGQRSPVGACDGTVVAPTRHAPLMFPIYHDCHSPTLSHLSCHLSCFLWVHGNCPICDCKHMATLFLPEHVSCHVCFVALYGNCLVLVGGNS